MLLSTILTLSVIQPAGSRRHLRHAVIAYIRVYEKPQRLYDPSVSLPYLLRVTFVSNRILHPAITLLLTVAVTQSRNKLILTELLSLSSPFREIELALLSLLKPKVFMFSYTITTH